MCVVYGTGTPRCFEFGKAEHGKPPPEGATVFASCDGTRVNEWLDEYLFEAMTDGEYYEMSNLADELRLCDFIGSGCPYKETGLKRFFHPLRYH